MVTEDAIKVRQSGYTCTQNGKEKITEKELAILHLDKNNITQTRSLCKWSLKTQSKLGEIIWCFIFGLSHEFEKWTKDIQIDVKR